MDHVVSEIQRDFIQREIGVLDLLGEHDVAIAIVARTRSGSVGTYGELPDLKLLGGDSVVVGLPREDTTGLDVVIGVIPPRTELNI
jgi:hypothetical protein